MNNKFIQTIAGTADGIKLARATTVAEQAKLAQEALINELKVKLQKYKMQVVSLSDLAPDTTDSLRIAANFNPTAWAAAVQDSKVTLDRVSRELDIAVATYTEWFGEITETA